MSKPRFNWWPFALNMIHDYPARRLERYDLREQKNAASMSCQSDVGGCSKIVEGASTKLPLTQHQKEFDAVRKAIELTRKMDDGAVRMKTVDLTLWKKSTTIAGAAIRLNISERTAQRYRWQFVTLVGHTYGFLTKEEYDKLVQNDHGNEKRNTTA